MSNLDVDSTNNDSQNSKDFGSYLASARKTQNYTIEDVTEHIKIPGRLITALEKSDLTALPEPIFAQGYLRAYAKFLEVPEDSVLEAYNRAIPQETNNIDLKSSSSIPNEANSQSPWVKLVTLFLLFVVIAAAIYAGNQYYQEKADIMETELESKDGAFTGNSLDSPGKQPLKIEQNARLTEDGELIVGDGSKTQGVDSSPSLNPAASVIAAGVDEKKVEIKSASNDSASSNKEQINPAKSPTKRKGAKNQKPVVNIDEITFIAKEDAWLEVRDASSKRLFYNMLKKGLTKSFKGRAPFRISLGNARTTRVLINDIEVDMRRYIRPSNTAGVTISSENGKVIFHK